MCIHAERVYEGYVVELKACYTKTTEYNAISSLSKPPKCAFQQGNLEGNLAYAGP